MLQSTNANADAAAQWLAEQDPHLKKLEERYQSEDGKQRRAKIEFAINQFKGTMESDTQANKTIKIPFLCRYSHLTDNPIIVTVVQEKNYVLNTDGDRKYDVSSC